MKSLALDAIEAKAMDFQTAAAIAFTYANPDAQRLASRSARRYLWAAIERRQDHGTVAADTKRLDYLGYRGGGAGGGLVHSSDTPKVEE